MYLRLTQLRLRWYALATGRILMRHWQMFVIAGVTVPANVPVEGVIYALAFPLMALFNIGHDLFWHLSYLILIQLVALTWVLVQKGNIASAGFMSYVSTLPVSLSLRRGVNLTVLLFANSLLLAPVFGLLLIVPTRFVLSADKGFLIAAVCVLVVFVHLAQLAAFERQRAAFPVFALADLLFAWALSRPVDAVSWLILAATLPSAAALLLPFQPPGFLRRTLPHQHAASFRPLFSLARLAPAWRIQLKALWGQHTASSATRMVVAVLLAAATDGLMSVFQFDGRTLPAAIIAMGVIALSVSGLYRVLKAIHLPMQHYLASLPLNRYFWILRDTGGVFLFGTVPLLILLVPLLSHFAPLPVLALVLAYFGLLGLLRFPQLYGGRQALLLSVMLAGAWSGTAMAAIL